jgi:hypothetical protein
MERGAISSGNLMAMVEILEGVRISASRIKVVLAIEGIWWKF